jgi:hypothetical protein
MPDIQLSHNQEYIGRQVCDHSEQHSARTAVNKVLTIKRCSWQNE